MNLPLGLQLAPRVRQSEISIQQIGRINDSPAQALVKLVELLSEFAIAEPGHGWLESV